jgi:hypothetical protein
MTRLSVGAIAGACAVALLTAAPALAGPGLPVGYDVQRIDSPTAGNSGGPADTFGFNVFDAGDINGDGEEDFMTSIGPHLLNDGNAAEDGSIVILSGETGAILEELGAPDGDGVDAGCSLAAGAADRCPGFGTYLSKVGERLAAPPFTDLGSCPGGDGGDPDSYCDVAVAGADGVPDIVASAPYMDSASTVGDNIAQDVGSAYVIDGATLAVLKRIDMPPADVDDLNDETEQINPAGGAGPARPWFGRTVLVPRGQPPCAGNAGVGACAAATDAVKRGDLDNAGSPDIVIGASAYKYEEAEGNAPPSCGDNGPAGASDVCIRSGRLYMYRGEDIIGTTSTTPLAATGTGWNIQNPFAQEDELNPRIANQLELWGHSVAPIGDYGRCSAAGAPGTKCPAANIAAPDGKPDVLISAFRVDYPVSGPDNPEGFEIGVNSVLDGDTGRILQTWTHPDEQTGSVFGFTITNQPAVGDMGGASVAQDVYIPAGGQDTDTFRGEGIGYVMNGASFVSGNTIDFQKFRDPTPNASGSFGTTAAGVGDLASDPKNDILIGEFPNHNPPQNNTVISDVHVFDPLTGLSMQNITDPDQQPVSDFGLGLAPLGDLNEDSFLDFVASAPLFDVASIGTGCPAPPAACADVGRLYLLRSNNTPPASGGGGTGTPIVAQAGRMLGLSASKKKVRKGKNVTLTGLLDAFSNAAQCEPGQTIALQRRRPGSFGFAEFDQVVTGANGAFSDKVRVRKTFFYRAVASARSACQAATSQQVKVKALKNR